MATGAVAFLVGASRWGSHIGSPPIYLTDLLLLAAIIHFVYARYLRAKRRLSGASLRTNPGIAYLAFVTWVLLRAAFGLGDMSIEGLRDLAPYAYAIVGLFSASAYSRSTAAERDRTAEIVRSALLFHLGWVLLALVFPGLVAKLPGVAEDINVLSLRRDFDGAMVGVLAGLALFRTLRGRATRVDQAVLPLSALALALIGSRAGLLGAVGALGLAAVAAMGTGATLTRKRVRLNAAVLAILLASLVLVAPSTTTGSRLIATIDPSVATSEAQFGALGTARARSRAWGRLRDWVEADPGRQVVGVGFGPDFLHESGADLLLLAREAEDVRSPHNYLLGTYARLGLIGLLMWSVLTLQTLMGIRRRMKAVRSEGLLLIASMVVVVAIPIGVLGVVLESPFGAIPFFWSVGILLTKPISTLPGGQRAGRQVSEGATRPAG